MPDVNHFWPHFKRGIDTRSFSTGGNTGGIIEQGFEVTDLYQQGW
jgi:hypothetical protein